MYYYVVISQQPNQKESINFLSLVAKCLNDAAPESHWKFPNFGRKCRRKPPTYYPRERDAIGPQSPANVVAPLCCCCWFCAVLHWGDNCLCSSGPQITAAAHGRPPLLLADYTQTKTEKRGTKSSAPTSSQLYMTETLQSTTRVWTEETRIDISWFLLCVKKLCVIPFKSLGNCRSQVITTTLETSPKKTSHWIQILQKWVWNGFWVGPFWHFWLPTAKVRWHFFESLFAFILLKMHFDMFYRK